MIQSFATQLEAAAKKAAIEQVIESLGGAAPATKRRGRPKGSKNVASGFSGDMGPAILAHVRSNPSARADQIAKSLRTTPNKMRPSMQTLLDSKHQLLRRRPPDI